MNPYLARNLEKNECFKRKERGPFEWFWKFGFGHSYGRTASDGKTRRKASIIVTFDFIKHRVVPQSVEKCRINTHENP